LFVLKVLSLLFQNKLLGIMTKQDHINYWLNTANDNWADVQRMFKARSYVPCLFFTHLVFEKLAKAIWVKHNVEDIPPRIHNIISILNRTEVELTEDEAAFFEQLNAFQMETRYPSYREMLERTTNRKIAKEILAIAEIHKQSLITLILQDAIS
jgi:HEPN domain-containing protein